MYATQWILEVNGKETPDLDKFLAVTQVGGIFKILDFGFWVLGFGFRVLGSECE